MLKWYFANACHVIISMFFGLNLHVDPSNQTPVIKLQKTKPPKPEICSGFLLLAFTMASFFSPKDSKLYPVVSSCLHLPCTQLKGALSASWNMLLSFHLCSFAFSLSP